MKSIYEVQKFGTTVEWTDKKKDAEAAFKETSPGEVVLYQIVGDRKIPIAKK